MTGKIKDKGTFALIFFWLLGGCVICLHGLTVRTAVYDVSTHRGTLNKTIRL